MEPPIDFRAPHCGRGGYRASIFAVGALVEGHLADRPWTRPEPRIYRGNAFLWANVGVVVCVGAGIFFSPVVAFIMAPCFGLLLAYLSVPIKDGGPAPKWL